MRHALVAVFDPAMGRVLSEVLELEGYHVTQALDQDQLIAVLRSVCIPSWCCWMCGRLKAVHRSATSS